jgi:hypothetical protein
MADCKNTATTTKNKNIRCFSVIEFGDRSVLQYQERRVSRGRFSVFFVTVSSDFNDFSVEKNVESQAQAGQKVYSEHAWKSEKRIKPINQRYMNWIVWLLFLFEIVHTVKWLSMDSSTTTSKKRRDGKISKIAILNFKTPLADQLGVARRETGRKRKETPAMAEFMNEQLTKKKRGRKSSKTVSSHFESDF